MRLFFSISTGLLLLATSLPAQEVLVTTRLHPTETIAHNSALELDLADFFQRYPAPGPVATFTIPMPVSDGERELFLEVQTDENGQTLTDENGFPLLDTSEDTKMAEMPTFQLQEGDPYQHALEVHDADQFQWETHSVSFQLFADEAPVTVANFLTYVRDGAYTNTIIHRNENTGKLFQPGSGMVEFNRLPIIQTGGWTLYDNDDYLLDTVQTMPSIPLEQTRSNPAGTLSMARSNNPDSATSQFFFNLEDNSGAFGDNYAVFGELTDPDEDLPLLNEFAQTPVHDLTNIYQGLPFSSIPLYTPYFRDKDSYPRIASVEVSEGNPEGISYDWQFADTDEDAEPTEEQLANRAVFDVALEEGQLVVDRSDTGQTTIEITAATDDDQTASFTIDLTAFDPEALRRFPSASIEQGGRLNSPWYGSFEADSEFPYIRHDNHGRQYLAPSEDRNVLFFYDFQLESWLYTSQILYPTFYNYSRQEWIRYQLDTGDGETEPRWFYNFSASDDEDGWFPVE